MSNIKKITKKPNKDRITTVRLTTEQTRLIELSSRMNNVKQSKVIQEAVSSYFNLKDSQQMKTNLMSVMISDKHKRLLYQSQAVNDCKLEHVIEDVLNQYYGINEQIEKQIMKFKRLFTAPKQRKRIVLSSKNKSAISDAIKMAKINKLFKKHEVDVKRINSKR